MKLSHLLASSFLLLIPCIPSFSLETPTPVSFDTPKRLLLLDGDEGTVACRIYGNMLSGTLPRFSDNWTLECATRSLLRMNNLTAVRGIPGASMVGPVDYLGNLEDPDHYLYTIQNSFPPVVYRTPLPENPLIPSLQALNANHITTVKALWISGREEGLMHLKKEEYQITPHNLRQSLFLYPGLLEIDRSTIELAYFDPRGIDLSSFKARLVNNQIPFQMTKRKLPPKDDYRLITYLYEPFYADWQVEYGSGLFLEKHLFSQSITPLTPDSSGFVALARTNDNEDELELIAVHIPYGYTLIIEEDCIHGDTTLQGFFLMGMTSDHTTMRTANTVFLKDVHTKRNVNMVVLDQENVLPPTDTLDVPPPYVIYKNATEKDRLIFKEHTQGKNFIFNPFSREYWHRAQEIKTNFLKPWLCRKDYMLLHIVLWQFLL